MSFLGFNLRSGRLRDDTFNDDDITKTELTLPGMPVSYYIEDKKISVRVAALESYKLGVVLDAKDNLATVMYKGFLSKNQFYTTVEQKFMQYDIKTEFINQRANIIKHMPNIKRLKRLKLKLFDEGAVYMFQSNFDKVIKGYSAFFGEDEGNLFKENILTNKIYVYKNGNYLLYSFHDNEYYIPSLKDNIGYFLCYFTYTL